MPSSTSLINQGANALFERFAGRIVPTRRVFLKGAAKAGAGALLPANVLQLADAAANPISALAEQVINSEAFKGVISKFDSRNLIDVYNAHSGYMWNFSTSIGWPNTEEGWTRGAFQGFTRSMADILRLGYQQEEDQLHILNMPWMKISGNSQQQGFELPGAAKTILHNAFNEHSSTALVQKGLGVIKHTFKRPGFAKLTIDQLAQGFTALPGWAQLTEEAKVFHLIEADFIAAFGIPSGKLSAAASLNIAKMLKAQGKLDLLPIQKMMESFGPATIEKAFIASRKLGHELLGKTAEEAEKLAQDEYDQRHKETYFEIRRAAPDARSRRSMFVPPPETFTITLTNNKPKGMFGRFAKLERQIYEKPEESGIAPVIMYLRALLEPCAQDYTLEYKEGAAGFTLRAGSAARKILMNLMDDRRLRQKDRLPINAFHDGALRPVDTANWLTLAAAIKTRTAKNALG